MLDPSVDRERRRAADLRTGDRIIPGDLIGATAVEEVLSVFPFTTMSGPQVLVVMQRTGCCDIFSSYFRADDSIAIASGVPVPEGVAGHSATGRASVHKAESGDETTAWWTCMRCGEPVPATVSLPDHAAAKHL